MIRILCTYGYSYDIEDIRVSSHDVGLSDGGPSNICPFNIDPSNIGVGPSMMPPSSMQNESDDDDTDDNVVQPENNIYIATEKNENGTEWVNTAYANNEYVLLEDPYPDEFEGKDWVDMTVVENTIAEHTRCVSPLLLIFESW